MTPCTTCAKAIAESLDAVVCGGTARHLHHARCAERAGVCGACRAIVFHPASSAGSAAPVPGVRAALIAPDQPVWIPARWDGACVYCPACHGVSPWPGASCAYCDLSLEQHAKQDPAWLARCIAPYPPPGVLAVALGVRFLAVLHLGAGALIGAAGATSWSTLMPVHGEIGDPAQVHFGSYIVPRLACCLVMAFALNALVRRLERGSHPARVVLFVLCAVLAASVVGIPIAALLAIPLLFPASRAYFRKVEPGKIARHGVS